MTNETLVTRVQTTIIVESVSALTGSAGAAINSSLASVRVRLRNKSQSVPIEYRIGTGAWNLLLHRVDSDQSFPVDLSTTQVFLRKGAVSTDVVSVEVGIDSAAGLYFADDALPIVSFTLPVAPDTSAPTFVSAQVANGAPTILAITMRGTP